MRNIRYCIKRNILVVKYSCLTNSKSVHKSKFRAPAKEAGMMQDVTEKLVSFAQPAFVLQVTLLS